MIISSPFLACHPKGRTATCLRSVGHPLGQVLVVFLAQVQEWVPLEVQVQAQVVVLPLSQDYRGRNSAAIISLASYTIDDFTHL